jgi:hypothetical protein
MIEYSGESAADLKKSVSSPATMQTATVEMQFSSGSAMPTGT